MTVLGARTARLGLLAIAVLAAIAALPVTASAAPPACTSDPGHQPPRDINSYLLFSWTDLYIKGGTNQYRGSFNGGNIGVNGAHSGSTENLTMGSNYRVVLSDGNSAVGDAIRLGPGGPAPTRNSTVWDLYTNEIVNSSFVPSAIRNSGPWCYTLPVLNAGDPSHVAFTHSTGPYNPTLPSFPSHATLATKPDVTVNAGATYNLPPGDYGTVDVKDDATLNFDDGIYNIDGLGGHVRSSYNTEDGTEVRIATTFLPGDDLNIVGSNYARFYIRSDGVADDTNDPSLTLSRNNDGSSPDDCGQDHSVHGQFYVPNGFANLGDCVNVYGRIWTNITRNDTNLNGTYAAPGGVTGTKYDDQNGNGVIDPGEPGLAGWTFYVDYNNNGSLDPGEPSDDTDSNGDYEIQNVDPGSWNVREVSQAGWTCSFPGTCLRAITIGEGDVSSGNDFANYEQPSVNGTKWQDVDGNGSRDPGDDGLAGWTFYVDYNDNASLDPGEPSDVSDSIGDYTIIGVAAGTYKVREVSQGLWNCTSPSPCYWNESFSSGSALTDRDFGNHPDASASTASGTKWQDVDGDGTRDPGDNDLAGWTFYVDYNDNAVLDAGEPSDVGDSSGDFTITGIAIGNYKIRELSQTDWSCTSPSPCYYDRNFTAGSSSTSNDFGNVGQSTAGGTKWFDVDGNGSRDPGDDGLAGWTFYVDYNDNGSLDPGEPSDATDSNGDYVISGIDPGSFKVREVGQASWDCTSPSPCYYSPTFTSDSSSTGSDFGNHPNITTATAHGSKWQDVDGNGVRDPGDNGLAGWTFYVDYNDNAVLDPGEPSDVSDSNGDFDIAGVNTGDHKVREVSQADWSCTSPSSCYYDRNFVPGADILGNDFGNHNTPPPPPVPPTTPPITPGPPEDGGSDEEGGTNSGKTSAKITGGSGCVRYSRARVRGKGIKRVSFRIDGKSVKTARKNPFYIMIGKSKYPRIGKHRVRAKVTFDSGATKSLSLTFHSCASRIKTRLTG